MTIKLIDSVATLAKKYDAFLLDLWGVIHDGNALYPGVRECLKELRAQEKKIIFLSNAPRRAFKVIEVLERLGIPERFYDCVVSSGEVAYTYLNSPTILGNRYYYIGPERDAGLLAKLDYQRMASPLGADFLLNAGFEDDDQTIEAHIPTLKQAMDNKLPMICVNPDKEVVKINGTRLLCAGVIAEYYHAMGGEVIQFGKPYQEVYTACFNVLAGIPKNRILAVGDNLDTDIAGALGVQVASTLVTGGILQDKLNMPTLTKQNVNELSRYCLNEGHIPNFAIAAFVW